MGYDYHGNVTNWKYYCLFIDYGIMLCLYTGAWDPYTAHNSPLYVNPQVDSQHEVDPWFNAVGVYHRQYFFFKSFEYTPIKAHMYVFRITRFSTSWGTVPRPTRSCWECRPTAEASSWTAWATRGSTHPRGTPSRPGPTRGKPAFLATTRSVKKIYIY